MRVVELRRMNSALLADRLERFAVVLDGFRRLKAASAPSRLLRMAAVVDSFAEIVARRPAAFNSLAVLRVGADEVVHSGVLAWLLDASAGHRQGPLFLDAFAQSLGLPIAIRPHERYAVRREFSGREAIIDVCVCRPHDFLIYVENKIWAAEGPHQVDREWCDLQRTGDANGIPLERRYAVFLTPAGRSPVSGVPSRWLCLSYRTLVTAFRSVVPAITDRKVAAFLSDWLDTISQWGAE